MTTSTVSSVKPTKAPKKVAAAPKKVAATVAATPVAQTTIQADAKERSDYIDLLTTGSGLVSRIREVSGKQKRGKPSLYCTVSVPLDPKGTENARWTSFDVRVCGAENIETINAMRPEVLAGKKPVINFTIGDIYGDAYEYASTSGPKIRAQYKGRLIRVEPVLQGVERHSLRTWGLGFVNKVKNDPETGLYIVDIAAQHGLAKEDEPLNLTYFSAYVSHDSVSTNLRVEKILASKKANPNAKVQAAFELTDLQVAGFAFSDKSPNRGQLGTNCHARLTKINWLSIDGTKVDLGEGSGTADAGAKTDDDIPF